MTPTWGEIVMYVDTPRELVLDNAELGLVRSRHTLSPDLRLLQAESERMLALRA